MASIIPGRLWQWILPLNRVVAAIIIILSACGLPASAQNLTPTDQACLAQIENGLTPYTVNGKAPPHMALADRMAFYHVPGISIAVIRNGCIAWVRGYGVTRIGGPPVTPETRFEAASISKVITAIGVLSLVQAGKLDLDTDVNQYLTSWKAPDNSFTEQRKVTIRELLCHTAGITDTSYNNAVRSGQPAPTLLQVLNGRAPADNPPVTITNKPGSVWRYSGGGYVVLAQILEDVAREPFPQYLRNTVLGPLAMTHSTFQRMPSDTAMIAMPYDTSGALIKDGPYAFPLGEDGLWTTPSDLARCAISLQASFSGRLQCVLTKATAHKMLTAAIQVPWLQTGQSESWGLGVKVAGSRKHPYFAHSGHDIGYECELIAYHNGDGMAIMTNSDNGFDVINEVRATIARIYHWPDFQPIDRKIVSLAPKLPDRYIGYYEVGPYGVQRITRAGDHLYCGTDELIPENERTWINNSGDRYTFEIDKSGRVMRLTLPLWSISTVGVKVDVAEAKRIEERCAAKDKSQSQDPGTEAALRKLLDQLRRGQPDYGGMIPGLANVVHLHLQNIQATLAPYGPLRTLYFQGVTASGWDLYRAEFESGILLFRIGLTKDGKIAVFSQRRSNT